MTRSEVHAPSGRPNHGLRVAGIALAIAGLCGHLLAARAIAWNPHAYPHHVAGFFIILAVTGSVIAALG